MSNKYIGSHATQRVSTTVSTLFFYRSEGGDEDNIPTKGVVGEAVHNVKVKNVESRDVLGPLPQFHQSVL